MKVGCTATAGMAFSGWRLGTARLKHGDTEKKQKPGAEQKCRGRFSTHYRPPAKARGCGGKMEGNFSQKYPPSDFSPQRPLAGVCPGDPRLRYGHRSRVK